MAMLADQLRVRGRRTAHEMSKKPKHTIPPGTDSALRPPSSSRRACDHDGTTSAGCSNNLRQLPAAQLKRFRQPGDNPLASPFKVARRRCAIQLVFFSGEAASPAAGSFFAFPSLGPSLSSFTAPQIIVTQRACLKKRRFVGYMFRSVSQNTALVMPPRHRVSES